MFSETIPVILRQQLKTLLYGRGWRLPLVTPHYKTGLSSRCEEAACVRPLRRARVFVSISLCKFRANTQTTDILMAAPVFVDRSSEAKPRFSGLDRSVDLLPMNGADVPLTRVC